MCFGIMGKVLGATNDSSVYDKQTAVVTVASSPLCFVLEETEDETWGRE